MLQPSYTLIDSQTKEMALRIAYFKDNSHFNTLRKYNHFSMLLVTRGKGSVRRDGTSYLFESPCLLPFAIYQPFNVMPEHDLEGVLINFHPSFFCLFKHRNEVSCNGVLFNNLYDTPMVRLSTGDLHSLSVLADQLKTELGDRPQPDEDVLLSYLKIFLLTASRAKIEQRQNGETSPGKMPPIAEKLTSAIELHFKTLHTPADYSDLLHLSTKTLNKASKDHFNKTLTDLIAERLIIEAKRELYLTSKSVKEIAFELGYEDEFYFSRYFRKKVGVSPQIFRNTVGFDKLTA